MEKNSVFKVQEEEGGRLKAFGKKKITAMMQRRGIGDLVQSWRGKINVHYMHFT